MEDNHTLRLPGRGQAEIDQTGQLTILQDAEHMITLQPGQAYELVTWIVQHHLSYLEAKSDETEQQNDIEAEKQAYDYEV